MNRAGRVILILGFFIAIISGCGIFALLTLNQPQPVEAPTTKIVVAVQEIRSRSEIVPDQVGIANWPRAVPTPVGAFDDPLDVVGKLALSPLYPGQPVLAKILVDKPSVKETRGDAALFLEKGTVGIAMPVTIKTNVAEAVQPGDRVDVIATFRSQSTTAAAAVAVATQRLLADVLVLGVGSWSGKQRAQTDTAYTIVTFQLTEQEALVLEYALLHAESVTLVLRPANDREIVTLEPVTFDYINQRYGFKLPR